MYEQLRGAFEKLSNREDAAMMRSYMRDKFAFYGIKTVPRRAVYKALLKEAQKNERVDWILLTRCWQDEHREFHYFVVDYLIGMKKFLTYNDIDEIWRFIKTKQWWDTIDMLSTVVGFIVANDGRGADLMLKWSVNDDFWVRRIAIIHQLHQKQKTNVELLERVIVNNLGSSEFFINKAIGWSLRDYSKTNPVWVKGFLDRYRSELSSLSIREAKKYL
ncbi:MAG: DNA alkylation repair protein [Bacteroidota bacterium]|jgi:3-methyladenine DNA glycosylase AlkD|nr:DNA alkylation repair protein [Bacteroidota bacterium]HHU97398.1 DNA alkylation repair protein [Petrimonas sp.]